jgi:hypothetical protein
MKYHSLLYVALIGTFMIFFPASGMQSVTVNKDTKEKISLIFIIEQQQKTLDYVSVGQPIYTPDFFKSLYANISATLKADPANETEQDKPLRQYWQQQLKIHAVDCINAIIKKYPLIDTQLKLIEERFQEDSLFFLRKTVEHNEAILKQQPDLFAHYQQIIKEEKPIPVEKQPIITTKTTSTQPATIELKPLREKITNKYNKIKFNELTYKGLLYDYQAFTDCKNRKIPCKQNDPFIRVEITIFDEHGNIISHNQDMPLPLPIFIDDNGNIKQEIFLPISKRPFIIDPIDINLLQEKLPYLAIKFYNKIENGYNKNLMNYLVAENVIENINGTYIHGLNGCKELLEKYFELWGIPEEDYKSQPEITEEEASAAEPEPQASILKRFFTAIGRGIASIFDYLKSLFRW